jgi:outer membrane lipoprotein-sorting protein
MHLHHIAGTWLAVSLAIAGCASAEQPPQASPGSTIPPAANAPTLTQDSSIDQVLDALDARGDSLQDFTADVSLTDTDAATGLDKTSTGRMWMQRLGGEGDDARLRVTLDKPDKVEYVLDKGWLLDRDYTKRLEVRRQVLKPGQKMNLLKLGEGPFPLPLGQDKADVHKMFEVAKLPPKSDDPPGTIHAQLKPRPGSQFERQFSSIDFWVDPQSRFPVKIETADRNGTTFRTTELKNIAINTKIGDKDFAVEKVDEKTWQIREAPFEE